MPPGLPRPSARHVPETSQADARSCGPQRPCRAVHPPMCHHPLRNGLREPKCALRKAECRSASANGRHRVSHEHWVSQPTQHKPKHCRVDMYAIRQSARMNIEGVSSAAAIGPGSRLRQRPHCIEQVCEAGKPFVHRCACFRIRRHRVSEANTNSSSHEVLDEACRYLLGRERDKSMPSRGAVSISTSSRTSAAG